MPQIKKLWAKENTAILVNPGEESLRISYNAISIVVPPRDTVARPGVGAPWTHPSAELNGKLVPGTALIADVVTLTAEGGYKTVMAIDHVCRYLVRDRDDLFAQGFNIVETADQVHEAMTLGIPLYAESQDLRARQVLARELQRQKGYKDRGEVPPPSLSERLIAWAIKHLATRGPGQRAHAVEDIEAALQGRAPTPSLESVPEHSVSEREAAATPSPEKLATAGAVFQEAQAAGIRLNGVEMGNLLRGHGPTIDQVRLKIQAKKVEQTAVA